MQTSLSRYCKRYGEKERVIGELGQSTQAKQVEQAREKYQSRTNHKGLGVETKVDKEEDSQA